MKKQDITYQDKLNELRLDISHPNSKGLVFVLVEGKTDIRLFRKLFNLLHCKVESIPGGNSKVEDCVYELAKPGRLIIAIRDADFINLTSVHSYPKDGIYITDLHDIEMTLVCEDNVLEAVFAEYLGVFNLKNDEIRLKVLKSIEMVGYLKWLNHMSNLELDFDSGFQDLIEFRTNNFDFDNYLRRVLAKSSRAVIKDEAVIIEEINKLKLRNPDLYQLTNGHDFISALAKFINEFSGMRGLSSDFLASSFRIAYSLSLFTKTTLYSQIRKWIDDYNAPPFVE